jgi:hypothetical protein
MSHPPDPRAALRAVIEKWFKTIDEAGRPAWFACIVAREMAQPTPALDHVAEAMEANCIACWEPRASKFFGLGVCIRR